MEYLDFYLWGGGVGKDVTRLHSCVFCLTCGTAVKRCTAKAEEGGGTDSLRRGVTHKLLEVGLVVYTA